MSGYVAGLPAFLGYFAAGLGMLVVFAFIYQAITPQKEMKLVREGNTAATVAFLGTLLGFSLPLASAAEHSVSFVDFLIWTAIGGVLQLLAFGLAALANPGLPKRITDGEVSAGIWSAGIAIIVGLINAACMTY